MLVDLCNQLPTALTRLKCDKNRIRVVARLFAGANCDDGVVIWLFKTLIISYGKGVKAGFT